MPPPHGTAAEARSYSGGGSSRDTGSDYGQFDRAVSQAANNPPASQPSGGDGWSPGVQHSGMPTTPTIDSSNGDDIDAIYTDTSFDVIPEKSEASKFMDNITSNYKKVEVPLKYANMIMSPDPFSLGMNMLSYTAAKKKQEAAQQAYIDSLPTGEDEYGHGDYVEDVQDYSARVHDTDYSGLDQESQAEIDLDYAKAYNLDYFDPSEIVKDGRVDPTIIKDLPSGTQEIITDLVPYMAHVIGGSELPPSVFDKHFSNLASAADNIRSRYDEAKANTNEFITTPLTVASYGIFEDARLKGLI